MNKNYLMKLTKDNLLKLCKNKCKKSLNKSEIVKNNN
jgi:hypothetical protein